MLEAKFLKQFNKEAKKAIARGHDVEKLKKIVLQLIDEKPLHEKHRNHRLKGTYNGYWECHITPDWLLIYKKTKTTITFIRTGTHSDLF